MLGTVEVSYLRLLFVCQKLYNFLAAFIYSFWFLELALPFTAQFLIIPYDKPIN